MQGVKTAILLLWEDIKRVLGLNQKTQEEMERQYLVEQNAMFEPECPLCHGEISCLGGCSAHSSNWYCDDINCGWQAWDSSLQAVQPGIKTTTGFSQELKMYLVYDGRAHTDIESAQVVEVLGQKTEIDAMAAFVAFYSEPEYALISHVLNATGTVLSEPEIVYVSVVLAEEVNL